MGDMINDVLFTKDSENWCASIWMGVWCSVYKTQCKSLCSHLAGDIVFCSQNAVWISGLLSGWWYIDVLFTKHSVNCCVSFWMGIWCSVHTHTHTHTHTQNRIAVLHFDWGYVILFTKHYGHCLAPFRLGTWCSVHETLWTALLPVAGNMVLSVQFFAAFWLVMQTVLFTKHNVNCWSAFWLGLWFSAEAESAPFWLLNTSVHPTEHCKLICFFLSIDMCFVH